MHELPLIRQIVAVVDANIRNAQYKNEVELVRVRLNIGKLRGFVPSYVEKYWDFCTKDTDYAGSEIVMTMIDGTCQCEDCGNVYGFDIEKSRIVKCPECGCEKNKLLTGNELILDEIEVKTKT